MQLYSEQGMADLEEAVTLLKEMAKINERLEALGFFITNVDFNMDKLVEKLEVKPVN